MSNQVPKRKLDDLLGSVESLGKGTASRTSQQQPLYPLGGDVYEEIYKYLTMVRRVVANMPDSERNTVEIEARLGMVLTQTQPARNFPQIPGSGAVTMDANDIRARKVEYQSGVSAPSFQDVTTRMATAGGRSGALEERVYLYDESLRCIVRGGNVHREVKSKVANLERTFAMPSAPYDVRVTVATEDPKDPSRKSSAAATTLPSPADNKYHDEVPAGYEGVRSKKRVSYEGFSLVDPGLGPSYWRLDLTRVASESTSGGESGTSLEVELELAAGIQKEWVHGAADTENHEAQTVLLSRQLVAILQMLNPLEMLTGISNPPKEEDKALVAAAVERCAQLRRSGSGSGGGGSGGGGGGGSLASGIDLSDDFSGGGGGGNVFPGAMPVNFGRVHLAEVQESEYFIAEKTDGVRYLLVCCRTSNDKSSCVMVDRKLSVFRVEGGEAIAAAIAKAAAGQSGTVLDGELVHHLGQNRAVFMAFDILALGEHSLMGEPFKERFTRVRNAVLPAYAAAQIPNGIHLPLVAKRWFARLGIDNLWKNVKDHGRERFYKDGEGRFHKTDGIIFQPNTPYQQGTDHRLLKWKWKDLASVDLRVVRRGAKMRLETDGPGGIAIDLAEPQHPLVRLTQHDLMRLNADLKARPNCTIAEVAKHESGLWRYLGLRPDKTKPNFLTTVMFTLDEIAEDISPSELLYRMMRPDPAQDDWDKQLTKMCQAAVDHARKQLLATARAPPAHR